MMNRFTGAALTLAIVGVLSCSPQPETTQAKMYLAAAQKMEIASFCANLLDLLEQGKTDEARQIAEWRMSSALKSADNATVDGFEADVATPHLEEGMRRAADYARRADLDPEVAAAAERVLDRLARTSHRVSWRGRRSASLRWVCRELGDEGIVALRRGAQFATSTARRRYSPPAADSW